MCRVRRTARRLRASAFAWMGKFSGRALSAGISREGRLIAEARPAPRYSTERPPVDRAFSMRACVVSSKECWKDETGRWLSFGGFPLQMDAISSLFDKTTLLVVAADPRPGGIPLPAGARVVAIRSPEGHDTRR